MCVLQTSLLVGTRNHIAHSLWEAYNVVRETSLVVGIGRDVAQSVVASPCVYHSLPLRSGVINT
jgi:hypothetical protein